jgi:hypothetical protein
VSNIIDIEIEYIDPVTNISIDEINSQVDHIVIEEVTPGITNIDVFEDVSLIFSVNGYTGNVILTYSETLPELSASVGVFTYQVNHNLNSLNTIVSVYDTDNKQVYADVGIINSNLINVNSLINLTGYKVVVQV